MLIPKVYQQKNQHDILDFIDSFPFSTLITSVSKRCELEANHIPLYRATNDDGAVVLKGHIARANNLHQYVDLNSHVLVVFHGPECYISPNLYPSKQRDGKAVPTWNYTTVHARGKITFIRDDADWLQDMLVNLTGLLEATQQKAPWKVTDAPDNYIRTMLRGIVGIEVKVELPFECQFKLSQDKSAENQQGVVDGLASSTREADRIVSNWVERYVRSTTHPEKKAVLFVCLPVSVYSLIPVGLSLLYLAFWLEH